MRVAFIGKELKGVIRLSISLLLCCLYSLSSEVTFFIIYFILRYFFVFLRLLSDCFLFYLRGD